MKVALGNDPFGHISSDLRCPSLKFAHKSDRNRDFRWQELIIGKRKEPHSILPLLRQKTSISKTTEEIGYKGIHSFVLAHAGAFFVSNSIPPSRHVKWPLSSDASGL